MHKELKYKEWDCILKKKKYYNGNIAIELTEVGTDEVVASATTNLDERLPQGYAYIKDYSENEGMLEALVREGVVANPTNFIQSGFVTIPICKVLV